MTQSTMSHDPPIVAAVIVHEGVTLLVRRRVTEGSLAWQFPAGEAMDGEPPEAAAVRETAEEVGITIAPRKIIGKRTHPATGRRMIYVGCDVVEGTATVVDTDELSDLAWCAVDRLAEYVPAGVYPPVLDYLLAPYAPGRQQGEQALEQLESERKESHG